MYNPYGYYPCNSFSFPAGYSNSVGNNPYSMSPNALGNSYPDGLHTGYGDYGPESFVVNIEDATLRNNTFRTALWTGNHLQLTLMSINAGEDIGLEIHPNLDQFIRIEQGQGIVVMGDRQDFLDFGRWVYAGCAFIIPAGKWHNLVNMGDVPLKLYSIYAPPQHPPGTVHVTRADAMAAE